LSTKTNPSANRLTQEWTDNQNKQ